VKRIMVSWPLGVVEAGPTKTLFQKNQGAQRRGVWTMNPWKESFMGGGGSATSSTTPIMEGWGALNKWLIARRTGEEHTALQVVSPLVTNKKTKPQKEIRAGETT